MILRNLFQACNYFYCYYQQAFVAAGAQYEEEPAAGSDKILSIFGITVFDMDSRPICLDRYRGKVFS